MLKDHLRAAEFYSEGYRTLGRLSEAQVSQMDPSVNRTAEQLLINAAVEYARADRPEEALGAIDRLVGVKGLEFPMTEHFVRFLSDARESPALSQYCDRAAKWLTEHASHKGAPRLAGRLGLTYERAGKYEQALPWIERALEYADDPGFRNSRHVDRKYLQTSLSHVRSETALPK